ncbi:hypothetical protein J1N35_011600 [Gossypium stocksii]|uniref:RNase H type-1 domain-containing protein n=1 Tax=Gossypium stocksii TaxID=47602 RepID=A0A9D4ABL9_9ROSI|nr:hypothetical protein J1N35_011600 [Gossypium stocksii]
MEIYGDELGDGICNFPIPHNGVQDTRTWSQNPYGIYTSKPGYSWLILKKVGFSPHRFFWRTIWKLKMLPKIKIFSWRIGQNILPTFDNIIRIRQGFNNICPRCQSREETLLYALKECPKAREILAAGGLNNRLLNRNYSYFIDWLEDMLRELDNKAAANFLNLFWNSWNDRNSMVFEGIVKINVDATVLHGCSNFGAIARDQDDFVLVGCYKFVEKSMEVNWAELEAFTEGLKFVARLNMAHLILESDNARLVNAINKRMEDITILGQRIKQECMVFNSFSSVKINWIGRKSNIVADELSNLAIKNRADLYFKMEYPLDIHNNIINDAIR